MLYLDAALHALQPRLDLVTRRYSALHKRATATAIRSRTPPAAPVPAPPLDAASIRKLTLGLDSAVRAAAAAAFASTLTTAAARQLLISCIARDAQPSCRGTHGCPILLRIFSAYLSPPGAPF